jgi:hypothetical protein
MTRTIGNIVKLPTRTLSPSKPSRRKRPDEWRAINRSARVKDGRAVLLAVADPQRAGELLVIEGYWCTNMCAWWAANCAQGLPGCDPLRDIYGEPKAWMPMPAPPYKEVA